jgi:ribosomal protein S18 acetylase RimI-like enzyme
MIHYLTVAPEFRRRGYGRAMVAAAGADQMGPTVALSVPGRPDALAFAAALGMRLGSQQMVKDLQP